MASTGLETNPYRRLVLFAALIATDSEEVFTYAYKRLAGGYGGRGTWNTVNRPLPEAPAVTPHGTPQEKDRERSRRYYYAHRDKVLARQKAAREGKR